MAPRFNSVILDVDSTLCALEGIDWLARQRGDDVAMRVEEVTRQAMDGDIALQAVYGARLAVVEPDAELLQALGEQYLGSMVPGAEVAVRQLRDAGVTVAIVSGGIRQAIAPLAERLGVPPERLAAVDVYLDEEGQYSAYDDASPLTTDTGKAEAARLLRLTGPVLVVGDGNTDLASRSAVDAFAAFTGCVHREAVVARADYVIESFDQLTRLVLS